MIYPVNKDEKTMINLTVVIDNDEAVKKLKELQNVAKTTTSSVVKDSERMDASWQQMKNSLMSLTAGVSFAALAKQVVQVRGEVQQLEVAFETMLGSKEKADTLMTEIIDLAAKTPFGLQDVSNATKMLLAYGSTAEQVTDEIKMLGNIASGLSIPLNDLIYLYGTTRTQGRMFTQDLRQFMGRGIPIAEELAKQFGVTKDKVGELVTAGKVGFDEMAKALQAMTSEGGKFNNLMDKQSQTIAGQISNLEDAIYQMFNEIGESSEGVISDLISGASWVVEHYQSILKVLSSLIAAYGAYKTAIIVVAAAQKAMALGSSIAMFIDLAKAITSAKDAMLLLNMATNANPLGILLSLLAAIGVAVWQFGKNTEDATRKMGELEKAAYDEYIEVNRLVGRLQDTNIAENERNKLLNKLKGINPDIVQGLEDEATMTAQLTANLKDYNDEQIRKIQLAGLDDKMQGEMKKVGDARVQNAQAQLDWSNFIADYQAKRAAGGSPDIDASLFKSFEGHITNVTGDIYDRFIEQLDRILMDKTTTDAYKMLKISEFIPSSGYASEGSNRFTGDTWGNVKDIGGSNIQNLIKQVYQSAENVKQAEDAFKKVVEEDKQLRGIIGDVADDTDDTGTAVKKYAQAYKDAQKKYLETQRALAEAEKDRNSKDPKLTEKEYLDLVTEAKEAKDAYEKLGGVTSTKAQTEAQKKAKELVESTVKLQNDATQAEIDAMVDGSDKVIAQIKLDYAKREHEISKQEADLIAKQGKPLTDEQQGMFNAMRKANKGQAYDEWESYVEAQVEMAGETLRATIEAQKAEENAWNEHLVKYGTLKEKILATTELYNRKIEEATTDGERKVLEAERDALLAEYEAQASDWAKSLVDMTTAQLNKMFAELQAQVEAKEQAFNALESSDSEDAQKYRDEINKLKAQIAVLNNELGKTERQATDKNWDESVQTFQEIARAANEAADGIAEFDEGLGNSLRSIAQLASTGLNLVVVIKKITDAAWTGAAAISAMEKASLILAAISAAIQVVSALFNLFRQSDEVEQTKRQFKELNDELERLHKLARIDNVEGTIFGPNPFGNFINNLKAVQDALKDLEASREAIANKTYTTTGVIAKTDENGYVYPVEGKIEKPYGNVNDAISNMRVKTKNRNWFGETFLGGDEYADLGDLVPELFDENGNVTLEGLQNLQNSDVWKKLGEKDRELIEQMIADWEDYNAAVEATEKYLSDVFGDLGGDITDALLEAFKSGTDAAEAFGEATGKILERLAQDIVNMALIDPIMQKAEKQILDLQEQLDAGEITYEEYLRQTKKVVDEAVNEAKGLKDDAYEIYEAAGVKQDSYSASASSKGFQTMSQETGSELNGRFTDIQGQTHRIAEAVEFCKSLHIENLSQVQSINATVAMIHNDTSLIAQHTRVLALMQIDIASIRRSIDDSAI